MNEPLYIPDDYPVVDTTQETEVTTDFDFVNDWDQVSVK